MFQENKSAPKRASKTLYTAFDTLGWQLLASVIIPGYIINRVCYFTKKLLKKTTKMPSKSRSVVVAATGVCLIPFIIHPIDHFVDKAFDMTIRKLTP